MAAFGTGLVGRPHGFSVDHEGNFWLTDVALMPGEIGAVVHKLSPAGDLVMTLGTPGTVGQDRERFNRPASVAVAENGDIFVADGEGPNNRIVKFSPDGRYLMEWGTTGSGQGQFSTPHDLAIDSQGRVLDRGNSRIQTRISGASGITSSHDDAVVYAADVAPWQIRKSVRR